MSAGSRVNHNYQELIVLSKTMNTALNEQIKWELYSGYLYLAMSAHLNHIGLSGFSTWMRFQALEELLHAMKFYDFVNERGGSVELLAVDAPPSEWKSPLELFEQTLEHEQQVTRRINALVDTAMAERDHATNIFLQWFVTEQVEEEDNVGDIVNKLKLVGNGGEGLFMLDKEMALRTPPTPTQA
jgi:ferritin